MMADWLLMPDGYFHTPIRGILARTPANLHLIDARPGFHLAGFGAMSSGNAPKSAGVGCAGKDGKARAEKKKRAPDLWTMLYVAKPMQTPAGHPHQQPPCSFLSKEVVEPQPALDTGEESDIDSMFSNDASDRKDLTQECSELATRLANANSNRCIHPYVSYLSPQSNAYVYWWSADVFDQGLSLSTKGTKG